MVSELLQEDGNHPKLRPVASPREELFKERMQTNTQQLVMYFVKSEKKLDSLSLLS